MLEVARVAEERPAGTGGPAEEAAHQRLGGDDDVADQLRGVQEVRRDHLREAAEQLDVPLAALSTVPAGEGGVSHRDQQMKAVLHRRATGELRLVDVE